MTNDFMYGITAYSLKVTYHNQLCSLQTAPLAHVFGQGASYSRTNGPWEHKLNKKVNSAPVCRLGYPAVNISVQPNLDQHMVLMLFWQQAVSEGISILTSSVLMHTIPGYGIPNQWKTFWKWGGALNWECKSPGILSYVTHKGDSTASACLCLIGTASCYILRQSEVLTGLQVFMTWAHAKCGSA